MVRARLHQWRTLGRLPLLICGIATLVLGIWGGLVRLPLNLPLPADNANWITYHGPLMVCGFLGTVIGLERAVGLQSWWTYSAPVLTATGSALLLAAGPTRWGQWLLVAGSMIFVAVTARVVQLQRAAFTILMSLAAVTWFVGNLLWCFEWPIPRVVPWWIAYLGLTIVGERLDLSRFQKPVPIARPLLFAANTLFLAGVTLSAAWQRVGEWMTGLGMIALAAWLARFDLARRTVRQTGLPRFMAICLLSGFAWFALAGILLLRASPLQSGLAYDGALHAFFLGFVFSMIFGHAPIIFPAVLALPPVEFRPRFYLHLVLLNVSLLLRLGSDLAGWADGRQYGAIGNGLAIAVFLVNTVTSVIATLRRKPAKSR